MIFPLCWDSFKHRLSVKIVLGMMVFLDADFWRKYYPLPLCSSKIILERSTRPRSPHSLKKTALTRAQMAAVKVSFFENIG